MVWDSSAVAFREIAPEDSKEHRRSCTDDHKGNAGGDSSCEVRKEEDSNSRVHQNRQHSSRDALRHVATSRACRAAKILGRNSHVPFAARLRLKRGYCFEQVRT